MSPDDERQYCGTAWGFRRGCRCDDCGLAWSRKNKSWLVRAYRNGGRTTVDAKPVAEHLGVLLERMSQRAIGDVIGSSPGYIGRIVRGDIKRVSIARAQAILNIDPYAEIHSKAYVSAAGATRRLRALTALGYSVSRISTEIGYTETNVKAVIRGDKQQIMGTTDALIRREYERLSMTLPVAANHHEQSGITRARKRAAMNGWPPPLAWDDINIDTKPPVVTPVGNWEDQIDDAVVRRVVDGQRRPRKLTRAESTEVVRVLLSLGLSTHQIERDYGINVSRYRNEGSAA